MGENYILEISDLHKVINGHTILDGLTLKVREKETYVVIGRSGIGKSVLLKNIVRLMEPDAGEIYFNGINILSLNQKDLINLRKSIGFLFQGGALFDYMNVEENILFALEHIKGVSSKSIAKVREVLEMVGLPDIGKKMPSELSGGMKKRVALARTIVTSPKFLLLDEPTTGLDPITTEYVINSIIMLRSYRSIPMVIVTHDINVMTELGDRVGLLEAGKIVFEGTVKGAFVRENSYIAQFLEGKLDGPIKVGY